MGDRHEIREEPITRRLVCLRCLQCVPDAREQCPAAYDPSLGLALIAAWDKLPRMVQRRLPAIPSRA